MILRALLLALALSGLVTSPGAFARDKHRNEGGGGLFGADMMPPAGLVDRRAPRLSAGDAARQAQKQYGGGKVLSVDPSGNGYRVKLLRDGDVRVVFIPDR